jgi:hypothetical protein
MTIRSDVALAAFPLAWLAGSCPFGFFLNTSASSVLDLSRRPRHRTAAKYVRVHMGHCLPGVAARIEDNAVAGVSDALGHGDFVRLRRYLGQ